MSERKLYVILTAKKINCLNHITGPVTTPTELNVVDALELVRSGFDVYEVNPYNKKERVKVTVYNFNSIRFKTTESDMIARKRLNREMQKLESSSKVDTSKEEKKEETSTVSSNKEDKKDDKKKDDQVSKKDESKKESEKKVDTEVKPQKFSHTDFEKH